jgi:DNA-binding HxlR family transcriptional regulator
LTSSPQNTPPEELIWLVNHRTRRKILLAIGDAGKISASSLRASLKISTGSLYYNLRQLEPLVAQDGKRNYYLTEAGLAIYKMLREGEGLVLNSYKPSYGRLERIITNIFYPSWVLVPVLEKTAIALMVSALSLLLNAALFINGKVSLMMLHIYHWPRFDLAFTSLSLAATVVAIYLYLSFATQVYEEFRRRRLVGVSQTEGAGSFRTLLTNVLTFGGQYVRAFAAISIGLLPMSIYPFMIFLGRVFGLNLVSQSGSVIPVSLAANVAMVVAQLACFVILTSSVSYIRGIRWHISALISFSLIYISIILQYLVLSLSFPPS